MVRAQATTIPAAESRFAPPPKGSVYVRGRKRAAVPARWRTVLETPTAERPREGQPEHADSASFAGRRPRSATDRQADVQRRRRAVEFSAWLSLKR